MPYIETKTNVKITSDQEKKLKEGFGKAISLLPGKSERWLMLSFAGESAMYFQGSAEGCAMLEVKIYGRAQAAHLDSLTGSLTGIVSEVLGVAPERVYIKYEECANWGWNGSDF